MDALNSGTHTNPHLQRDWYLYGPEAFEFKILQIVDSDDLTVLKQYERAWMDYLDAFGAFGYNIYRD
mgnify:FL=1